MRHQSKQFGEYGKTYDPELKGREVVFLNER